MRPCHYIPRHSDRGCYRTRQHLLHSPDLIIKKTTVKTSRIIAASIWDGMEGREDEEGKGNGGKGG